MARRMKYADVRHVFDVREAIHHLKKARDLMKRAGSEKTVERIRSALKSAGGAQRHVERRRSRSDEERA